MTISQYARALRKSWWIVLLLTALGGAGGYGYSARQTPTYASHISFYVGTPTISSTNANSTNQFAQDRATSYATLLRSDRLAQLVIDSAHLKLRANDLAKRISASAQLNTVVVDATVTDTSPREAQRIAGYVGRVFPTLVAQLDDTGPTATDANGKPVPAGPTVKLSLISGPTQSTNPVSPRTRLNELLGAGLGLVLGLAIAVLREVLDVSITTTDALRDFTGRPVLATVPNDRRAKTSPLLVGEQAHSPRAETIRQLRTNLRFLDVTRPMHLVQVTSSVEGEGKSTIAANLALMIAEDGRSVLLVEADVRKPSVSRFFGIESAVGMTDVLAGMVELDDVLQPWGDAGLTILPSGAPAPNPSELLGSPRATELLATVRERFDVVIVDSPPLLPVADASVLAPKMDGVLVVFRSGRSRRSQLRAALAQLESVGARVVGTVLNRRPSRRRERRAYGHYYARGSGAVAQRTVPPAAAEAKPRTPVESTTDLQVETITPPVRQVAEPPVRQVAEPAANGAEPETPAAAPEPPTAEAETASEPAGPRTAVAAKESSEATTDFARLMSDIRESVGTTDETSSRRSRPRGGRKRELDGQDELPMRDAAPHAGGVNGAARTPADGS